MALENDIPVLLKCYQDQKDRMAHNNVLFNIYEGDLLTYILKDLKEQLSSTSYDYIKHRVSPINILKRLIDKLSKIYAKPPSREILKAKDSDKKLLSEYHKSMAINVNLGMSNEFFNLYKNTFIEPYVDNGKPRLRILPSDRFFVYSRDDVNPLRPTHFIKVMGTYKKADGSECMIFYAYTDEEFLIFNDKEEILLDKMAQIYEDAPDEFGQNPFKKIPGIYINRSKVDLTPKIDTDTLAMTKLIPILLSDLNYAVMFQAFSIMYGIDLDEEGLKMAPNAFWRFKSSKSNPDAKPHVGVIKPEADIDKVLSLVREELAMWLNSKNIRPGTIGALNSENAASGVSKVIDEMDTSEDRQKQVPYFIDAERELHDLIINHMHPVWSEYEDFELKGKFSVGISVETTFPEQRPIMDINTATDAQIKQMDAGLQDRESAMKALNPDMTPEQIKEKLAKIDKERAEKSKPVEPGKEANAS